ncbi:iron complex transport system permease protein [Tamaricihabitans halophyticus]|uniref:Iron complex transport system permease protein n=1 Tax=Tamaricihabitans halophyticus TaxID=1262583 RepID=A0A4R2R4S6_9PSEU|nr:iron chelate uptake ABC transporter family permease subunit [Tamaricihabitans halophyticus]TCP56718.1 iron complex transport system permease protein [Tamaricihabitans halophyticus]
MPEQSAAAGNSLATRRRRRLTGLVVLVVALLLAALASVAFGERNIPLSAVWHAIFTPSGTEFDIIVGALRIPRTLLGLAVGIALGVAGALMQGHTRNPLADPGLLGVTQGAAFAVVLSITVFGMTYVSGQVLFAFAGALIASAVVFALGSVGRGGATPVTLALAGATISWLLLGLTSALVLLDQRGMEVYRFWRIGSLARSEYESAATVLPFLLVGLVLAVLNTPGLNTLALGEDIAKGLGQRVRLTRFVGLGAIALLTGSAVAACGPIAFVGLVVPHIARGITGADYRWLVPYAGLLGAILLLVADVLGRVLAADRFEVGIMLTVLGAPAFIYLVRSVRLVRL